jgi:hypothetical protein
MKLKVKPLAEYLTESVGGSYVFTIDLQRPFYDIVDEVENITLDEYTENILAITNGNDEFKEFVEKAYNAWEGAGKEAANVPFRFNGKGHCKLARMYQDILGAESKKIGNVKVELGNGSVGNNIKIKTEDQETATCMVWNAMIDAAEEDNFDINNIETVSEVVQSITANFPKSWIKSFQQQCIALNDFLIKLGVDPKNYHAIRYGAVTKDENNQEVENVGKAYDQFVKKYISVCEPDQNNIPKDNYDPSDIILYTDGALEGLKKLGGMNTDDSTEMNDAYRKELFDPRVCVGVSLKKTGKVGKVEFFNVNSGTQVAKINNMVCVGNNPNATKVECTGNFKFNGISDPTAEPEEGDTVDESKMYLEVRSFGKYIAMDIKAEKGPSLGKVPVRMWSKALGCNAQKNNLAKACKALAKLVQDDDKDTIQNLVQWGVKSGPWCLPFALVH